MIILTWLIFDVDILHHDNNWSPLAQNKSSLVSWYWYLSIRYLTLLIWTLAIIPNLGFLILATLSPKLFLLPLFVENLLDIFWVSTNPG